MRPVPAATRVRILEARPRRPWYDITMRPHAPSTLAPCAALLVLCAWILTGCTGSAHVDITALSFRAIDPPGGPPPRVFTFEMQRCFWWTDDAGRLWVAMDLDRGALLGRLLRLQFAASLALDLPPAGRGREYQATGRTLRVVARQGTAHVRFTSLGGIVVVHRASNNRLRGSFRFDTARQSLGLLGTWSKPARYLFMGTFEALPDVAGHGRRVAALTEAGGWTREEPATQPASQPQQPHAPTPPAHTTAARPEGPRPPPAP